MKRMGLSLLGLCVFVGCEMFGSGVDPHDRASVAVTKAICVLQPTAGNSVQGIVTFEQRAGYVLVKADVTGLTPGLHGFHIHEWGDISGADGKKTGGHFNPTGHDHSGPESDRRHIGDLGNLEADSTGHATYRREDKHLTLFGPNSIMGRGLIVHADEDDLTSQPTGAAGARVAQGVIGALE